MSDKTSTTNQQRQGLASTKMNTSRIDSALKWIISDIGSVILGGLGLIALVVGRLILQDDTTAAGGTTSTTFMTAAEEELVVVTRETLLAVVAIGAVLLNGLSQLDVRTALAEVVDIEGIQVPNLQWVHQDNIKQPTTTSSNHTSTFANNTRARAIIAWLLESIVQATPAVSAVYIERDDGTTISSSLSSWKIIGYVGVLPENLVQSPESFVLPPATPILDRFCVAAVAVGAVEETYLPTLPALPGKVEFSYLPSNTQAVLILSPNPHAVVVVGSNRARSFTPRDIAWCQAAITHLTEPHHAIPTTTTNIKKKPKKS